MNTQWIPSQERGRTRLAWLDSRHSFSFGHYYEPRRMGFGALRVINEDIVAPGQGFPTHPHANMEIVSIVLSGALAHRDSIGNVEIIQAGEVQRMSAGTGIEHSEYNPSATEGTHFLQIWLHPKHRDQMPSYEQRAFDWQTRTGEWQLVVSPDGEGGSLRIDQDARLFLATLNAGDILDLPPLRYARGFLQVIAGTLRTPAQSLSAGDGLAMQAAGSLRLQADSDAQLLFFDLS